MADLKRENDEIRNQLNVTEGEDTILALEHLQQDYSDILDDNDRLRDSIGDYEAEMMDLVAERRRMDAKSTESDPNHIA